MTRRFLMRVAGFTAALVISGALAAALLATEVSEVVSLAIAWVAFFLAAAGAMRLVHRHE